MSKRKEREEAAKEALVQAELARRDPENRTWYGGVRREVQDRYEKAVKQAKEVTGSWTSGGLRREAAEEADRRASSSAFSSMERLERAAIAVNDPSNRNNARIKKEYKEALREAARESGDFQGKLERKVQKRIRDNARLSWDAQVAAQHVSDVVPGTDEKTAKAIAARYDRTVRSLIDDSGVDKKVAKRVAESYVEKYKKGQLPEAERRWIEAHSDSDGPDLELPPGVRALLKKQPDARRGDEEH